MKTKLYRKPHLQPMYPYEEMQDGIPDGCSISQADRENGSPKKGDMIAVNPKNENDTWLVAEKFFKENYAEVL